MLQSFWIWVWVWSNSVGMGMWWKFIAHPLVRFDCQHWPPTRDRMTSTNNWKQSNPNRPPKTLETHVTMRLVSDGSSLLAPHWSLVGEQLDIQPHSELPPPFIPSVKVSSRSWSGHFDLRLQHQHLPEISSQLVENWPFNDLRMRRGWDPRLQHAKILLEIGSHGGIYTHAGCSFDT